MLGHVADHSDTNNMTIKVMLFAFASFKSSPSLVCTCVLCALDYHETFFVRNESYCVSPEFGDCLRPEFLSLWRG